VLCLPLAQLPAEHLDREMLVRADIGGCTQAFTVDPVMSGSGSRSATPQRHRPRVQRTTRDPIASLTRGYHQGGLFTKAAPGERSTAATVTTPARTGPRTLAPDRPKRPDTPPAGRGHSSNPPITTQGTSCHHCRGHNGGSTLG
jgi:hypothetical protein